MIQYMLLISNWLHIELQYVLLLSNSLHIEDSYLAIYIAATTRAVAPCRFIFHFHLWSVYAYSLCTEVLVSIQPDSHLT